MKARYAFHMSTVDMYDIPPAMRGIEEWIVAIMACNARKWGPGQHLLLTKGASAPFLFLSTNTLAT